MVEGMQSSLQVREERPFWSGRFATMIMLLVFASVALAPLLISRGREEVLLWRTASALSQFDSGQRETGLETLRSLAALQPNNFQVQQRLVECLIDSGLYGQAAEVAGAMHSMVVGQVREDQAHPLNLRPASSLYARSLVAAGRRGKALAVLQQTRDTLKNSGTLEKLDFRYLLEMSNEIAYHAALAGEQLDLARALMEELFVTRQAKIPFGKADGIVMERQIIICTALVSIETGDQAKTVELLDREIDLALDTAAEVRRSLLPNYWRWMAGYLGVDQKGEPAPLASMRRTLASIHFELGLLLSVRSLALAGDPRLETLDQCIRDRFQTADLGYDSDALLKMLPDLRQCVAESLDGAMLLDTAGLVRLKQGNLERAMQSLDLACIANDIAVKAIDGRLGENPQEMNESAVAKKLRDKMTAVLHLHRGQCHQALGNEGPAVADFGEVRKLGFEPDDPDLF